MDSYRIEWKGSAFRELRKMDRPVVPGVIRAVEALAENPFPPGCRKLRGSERGYRIRVGDYRVIYQVDCGERD